MSDVNILIPEDALLALKLSPEMAGKEIRLAAAMKLYEIGKLSSGAAAQLAGVPKPVFLSKLADYGINTFRQSPDELLEEIANA